MSKVSRDVCGQAAGCFCGDGLGCQTQSSTATVAAYIRSANLTTERADTPFASSVAHHHILPPCNGRRRRHGHPVARSPTCPGCPVSLHSLVYPEKSGDTPPGCGSSHRAARCLFRHALCLTCATLPFPGQREGRQGRQGPERGAQCRLSVDGHSNVADSSARR